MILSLKIQGHQKGYMLSIGKMPNAVFLFDDFYAQLVLFEDTQILITFPFPPNFGSLKTRDRFCEAIWDPLQDLFREPLQEVTV